MSGEPPVRVLAIDGGGVRGYIPALLLAEFERRAGRPASELFDLIVGTSTGAIIGIGVATGQPASALAEFYPRFGRRIFGSENNVWGAARFVGGPFGGNPRFGGNARHTGEGLEDVLTELLGDAMLSSVSTELAVTTFDRLSALPVVLSSKDARANPDYDLPLREVARATSAAPTFFPPHSVHWGGQLREFIDGGVWANNPSGVAVVESLALTAGRALTGTSVLMVSLGTGVAPGVSLLDGNDSWLGIAKDLTGLATSVWSGEVLARRALGVSYHRLQVLDARVAGAMNDPSESRLAALNAAASALIESESTRIDRLVEELVR